MKGEHLSGKRRETRVRRSRGGGFQNYVTLAGEFFVLAELALRRLDGTLTLGHTKQIDVLVLNRRTGRTFKVEVKTTEKNGIEHSQIFGSHYSWLMHERHGDITDMDLVYCFVLLEGAPEGPKKPRFFLVPAREVAKYIRWNHAYWRRYSTRRTGKVSALREFRIPVGDVRGAIPPSWLDGRWKRYEGNWAIFGPTLLTGDPAK